MEPHHETRRLIAHLIYFLAHNHPQVNYELKGDVYQTVDEWLPKALMLPGAPGAANLIESLRVADRAYNVLYDATPTPPSRPTHTPANTNAKSKTQLTAELLRLENDLDVLEANDMQQAGELDNLQTTTRYLESRLKTLERKVDTLPGQAHSQLDNRVSALEQHLSEIVTRLSPLYP